MIKIGRVILFRRDAGRIFTELISEPELTVNIFLDRKLVIDHGVIVIILV